MSDVVTPTSSSRPPSPDQGRVGRGGSTSDTPQEQGTSTQSQTQDQDTAAASPKRNDPAVILSSTLTHLQSGQRIPGEVVGQLNDGRIVLDTPQGTFVLDLKASLALGPIAAKTDVLLQVVTVGDDIEAAIVSLNDTHLHPPRPVVMTLSSVRPGIPTPTVRAPDLPDLPLGQAPEAQSTAPGQTGKPAATTSTDQAAATDFPTRPAPKVPAGTILTVERADASSASAIRPGTQIKLTIIPAGGTAAETIASSPTPPAGRSAAPPPTAPAAASTAPATKGLRPGSTTPPAAGTAAKAAPLAEPETPVTAPLPGRTPQAAGPSNQLSQAPAQTSSDLPARAPAMKTGTTFVATVVADPARPAPPPVAALPRPGLPAAPPPSEPPTVLQTPFGLLRVTQGPKLPEGAHMTVEISDVKTPAPQPPVRPPFDPPGVAIADLTRDWRSLTDTLKSIDFKPAPDAQGHVVAPALTMIPASASTAPPPMPPSSTLLFLLAALRMGDVKSWLGSDIANQVDKSGNAALLGKLTNDFANLARAAQDGTRSDWRPVVLPVHDGAGIQPVAWFIRRPYEGVDDGRNGSADSAAQPAEGTRFVVELNHRNLGEMQLDGLVHGKRFDLVVRSHQSLSETIRQDISGLFRKVLDAAGSTGEVMFQPGPKFPTSLRADLAHRAFEAKPRPQPI